MQQSNLARLAISLAFALACGSAIAEQPRYNQIALRAEVQQAVSHDILQVRLYAEDQHKDAAVLAKRITEQLNSGLETARENSDIKVSSGNRSSHPVYDEKRERIVAWRERGEIILESSDFAALSTLTGRLLNDLKLGSMQFSLSPVGRQQTEDQLIAEAITAFKARADIATSSLGGTGYKIVHLNLNSQFMPPPMFRGAKVAMMAESDSIAPSVEGGQADVTVSADGVIEVDMP